MFDPQVNFRGVLVPMPLQQYDPVQTANILRAVLTTVWLLVSRVWWRTGAWCRTTEANWSQNKLRWYVEAVLGDWWAAPGVCDTASLVWLIVRSEQFVPRYVVVLLTATINWVENVTVSHRHLLIYHRQTSTLYSVCQKQYPVQFFAIFSAIRSFRKRTAANCAQCLLLME